MNAKHIFLDQEKISQKQISIIDFITQILPNKMSRPEVDRPICLQDNRYSTYMFVVPGPEVEFSYLLNLQKVGVIWPSLSGSLLYL